MRHFVRAVVCALVFSASLGAAQTILEVAEADPGLSTLVSALKAAGLAETLQGAGPFTLFAPTNAAFLQVPPDELDSLLGDPAALQRVLAYHVVPAFIMARDAVQATRAPTLEGSELSVRVEAGNLLVNESKVVKFDVGASENVQASNGVIHVIDSVLEPPDVALAGGAPVAPRIGAPVSSVAEVAQVYETAALRSVRFPLEELGGSGVSGSVLVADYGFDNAVATILVKGTEGAGGDHPAHFHAGDCGSGGDIVIPLNDVSDSSGLSVTTVTAPYDVIVDGDHYLNIHSSTSLDVIVACGEVGAVTR